MIHSTPSLPGVSVASQGEDLLTEEIRCLFEKSQIGNYPRSRAWCQPVTITPSMGYVTTIVPFWFLMRGSRASLQ